MRIYEYVPEELDEVLPFRNAIFGHMSRDQWEAMGCTAVVAREGERLVGFIPLQYRAQRLNQRASIPVVYENAVGVAEGMRGRGIGTAMLDEAARFMADRVDALMVVRGGERSQGYRFYRRAGHADLMYARTYALAANALAPGGVEGLSVLKRDAWLALEPELLALYKRRYGRFGGGQVRDPGYWTRILDGHVYRERQWWLVVQRADGSPDAPVTGYLVRRLRVRGYRTG